MYESTYPHATVVTNVEAKTSLCGNLCPNRPCEHAYML